MKRLALALAAFAILVAVPEVAHARRLHSSRLQLDLEPGIWFEGGFYGGVASELRYGGVLLDARVGLTRFVALRASTSAFTADYTYGAIPDPTWMGRSWIGAELFSSIHVGELQLRGGASIEIGDAPATDDAPVRASFEEPPGTGAATRVRAGVSLGGNAGFVQLEGVDVRPTDASSSSYLDLDVQLLLLTGAFALDAQRALSFDAVLTDDLDFGFDAGIWQTLYTTSASHTSLGVTLSGDGDHGQLGVSLLHQR